MSSLSIHIKNLHLRPKLKVKMIEESVNNDNFNPNLTVAQLEKHKGAWQLLHQ